MGCMGSEEEKKGWTSYQIPKSCWKPVQGLGTSTGPSIWTTWLHFFHQDAFIVILLAGCMQRASFLFRSKDGMIPGTLLQFSYSELENATNKFYEFNFIGMGGSIYVYCGHLKDGGTVVIKRMKAQEGPNAESDFLTEIELISRLHHCHVVPLLGFCSEHQGKRVERLLGQCNKAYLAAC
ncbi:hypothetical protein POM88_030758 [Heracleum sosnowskyi]|uniref:Serine-threonine/tyrosine-protein kinase catalytic domain-containing protein n=1 Tax=Heracleum sosnowskyi TaxID=360622 RepID=A0AAD8MG14_9APIA|nr:hypothetical protein POM88_030758 [Heracleum sosnowskyi]